MGAAYICCGRSYKMNVLIFVMTMMMLLSVMTYAKLETFRRSQAFQVIYEDYMQNKERGYINARAEVLYDDITLKTKDGKQAPKINASPRIGIKLFTDDARREKGDEWAQTIILFKNLVNVLYGDQPFYKEIAKDRPSFIDDIINELTQAVDKMDKAAKPKKASDLANIKLSDAQLDRALYLMLRGAPYNGIGSPDHSDADKKEESAPVDIEPDAQSPADGDQAASEGEEHVSPQGYYSLLDFVTLSSKPKIRVFLARKEVLQSIFPDQGAVQSILDERYRLYRQAVNGEDVKELETKFKNEFEKMKDPLISSETLNFAVSKTRPNNGD